MRPSGVAASAWGVASVAAVAGPYLGATFLTHWVKFADATDPRSALGVEYQTVHFAAGDGVRLEGWFIPAACPGDATVIVAPGRGLSKACFLDYARMLRDNDYNVLLFDLRGEGGSEGHTRSLGVHEADDVLGALEFLKRYRPQESRFVFALGIAHGAMAAIAAAESDRRIGAVVVDSAFADIRSALDQVVRSLPRPLAWYVRESTLLAASAELGRNLFEAGPERLVNHISPRPLLIVHGQEDTISSPEDARRLYAAAGGPKALWQVPMAGHCQAIIFGQLDYPAQVLAVFKAARQRREAFRR